MKRTLQLSNLVLAALLLVSCNAISGYEIDNGRVRGLTKNAETGSFVRNVTIEIGGVGISTDNSGMFLLDGIELGIQKVIVRKTGYQTFESEVAVESDATAFLYIEMTRLSDNQ